MPKRGRRRILVQFSTRVVGCAGVGSLSFEVSTLPVRILASFLPSIFHQSSSMQITHPPSSPIPPNIIGPLTPPFYSYYSAYRLLRLPPSLIILHLPKSRIPNSQASSRYGPLPRKWPRDTPRNRVQSHGAPRTTNNLPYGARLPCGMGIPGGRRAVPSPFLFQAIPNAASWSTSASRSWHRRLSRTLGIFLCPAWPCLVLLRQY